MFMPMLFVHVTVCCDDVVVFFCKRQVPARALPPTLCRLRARLFYVTFVCKDAVPQGPSKRDRPEEGDPRLQVDEAPGGTRRKGSAGL